MSMPVRHTHHKHQRENQEDMPRKKANLGHKTVTVHASTEATPSPELDKAYELYVFANQLLTKVKEDQLKKPPPGSLVHFSIFNPTNKEVREKHFMWADLTSCEGPTYADKKTQNIKLFGLDHELCLQGFLKEGEVVFAPKLFDLEVSEDGNHAVNKITYKITVLTNDYFKRLKTAEGELTPIFPPPLLYFIQQYIS